MGLFSGIGHVLGNIGSTVKKAVTDTGHVVGEVADNPWTKAALAAGLAATGVGLPAAGAIMAADGAAGGALKPGGGLKPALGGAATGAVEGGLASGAGSLIRKLPAVAGAVLGAKGAGGAGGTVGPVGTAANGGAVDDGSGIDWGSIINGATGGGGSDGGGIDWGSLLGKVPGLLGEAGSFVKDHGTDLALGGLAASQALNAANASKRASDLNDKALAQADARWNEGADFRTQGKTGALAPIPTRDAASIFADPSNPFASAPRKLTLPAPGAPVAPPSDVTPSIPLPASTGGVVRRLTQIPDPAGVPTPITDLPAVPARGLVPVRRVLRRPADMRAM